ncbi:MAG: Vitamin B12 dependent methionine synthase activation subunit [Clostridia bacterium]|nr:Vitamin B12 dependent methionine synthase activation subunit [Clostridia bacterium]
MKNTVIVKEYGLPEINREALLRYMRAGNTDEKIDELIDKCISESIYSFRYSVCYTITDFEVKKNKVYFDHFTVNSASLSENLAGSDSAVIFGATIGIGIDRLINKYSRLSPAKALCIQAIGAERIETLCDVFNKEMNSKFIYTKNRFSPGYGDFDIVYQKDIFAILDCPKRIGLTLNSSLMMSPSKSVTAIIGFKREE